MFNIVLGQINSILNNIVSGQINLILKNISTNSAIIKPAYVSPNLCHVSKYYNI